jgi:hypothetical protein
MPYIMIKTNKKLFTVFALFLVIIMFVLTYTKRGHSYELDLYKSEQGWGYDILKNNKIYIHQPFIPTVEGQVPFKDKQSARKTGRLVIKKIRNHKSPVITREELKSIIRN